MLIYTLRKCHQGSKNVEFTVREDQRVYYYEDDSTLPDVKEALEKELTFMRKYKERTGIEWVGTTWPRPPVSYDMWNPEVRAAAAIRTMPAHPLTSVSYFGLVCGTTVLCPS